MQLAKSLSHLGTESAFKILAKAKAMEAAGRDIINLGIGAPDFRTPENIVEAGKKSHGRWLSLLYSCQRTASAS